LNAVEGFFAKLTRRRLKHGMFHFAVGLQAAINRFFTEHNGTEAKPFVWCANRDEIIAARNRVFQMLLSIHELQTMANLPAGDTLDLKDYLSDLRQMVRYGSLFSLGARPG
jgi:hypothetical protein